MHQKQRPSIYLSIYLVCDLISTHLIHSTEATVHYHVSEMQMANDVCHLNISPVLQNQFIYRNAKCAKLTVLRRLVDSERHSVCV